MDIIANHWQSILFALLVAARAIFSLVPSENQAVKIFGWIDLIITALVGGDKRRNKNKKLNKMALTTGIINGSDLKIMMVANASPEADGVVIDNVTDCSISVTNDFRDSTVKANAGYKALLPGMTSATLNFSAMYASKAAGTGTSFEDVSGFQLNKTKLDIYFTHVIGSAAAANAGDFEYKVLGYIESLELTGGTEDNASYTCSVQIVETIVRQVIPA